MSKLVTVEDQLAKAIELYKIKMNVPIRDIVLRDFIPHEDCITTDKFGEIYVLKVNKFLLLCGNKAQKGRIGITQNGYARAMYTNYDGRPIILIKAREKFRVDGKVENLRGYIIEKIGMNVNPEMLKSK